jgi:hypothetical protein
MQWLTDTIQEEETFRKMQNLSDGESPSVHYSNTLHSFYFP